MSETLITTESTPLPRLTPIQQKLHDLGAKVRFRHTGPTVKYNKTTKEIEQVDNGGVFCDVIDSTTGEHYATGNGIDETLALENAVEVAMAAPKPMTKAQKLDMARMKEETKKNDEALAAKDAEIAALKAKLAAKQPADDTEPAAEGEIATPPKTRFKKTA